MAASSTARPAGARPGARGRRRIPRERIAAALSPLGLVALWFIARQLSDVVPTPGEVAAAFPDFWESEDVLGSLAASALRVAVGLGIALLAAVLTVVAMLANERLRIVLDTYVFIGLAVPSAALALFALMVFGLSEVGVYVAVAAIAYPFVTIGIRDGALTIDRGLFEMADVYKLSWVARLRHVILPHIAPFLLASTRNAHALAWKVAIIAEVFMSRDGVGGRFSVAFDNFNLEHTVLWLGVLLFALFAIEYGVLAPIEKRIARWRPQRAPTRPVGATI